MKKCTKCGIEKELSEFKKDKRSKDKATSSCRDCINAYNRGKYAENIDAERERSRQYRANNPEKRKETAGNYYNNNKEACKAATIAWRKANPDAARAAQRKHKSTPEFKAKRRAKRRKNREPENRYRRDLYVRDPNYAIATRLRARFHKKCAGFKCGQTFELIGISPAKLGEYLESLFKPGMTWGNRSEWHIDHIRPLTSFNLKDEDEQRQAFHYTNLQPMWATDNLSKGARYDG